jgi:hypothetical protein
MKNIFTGNWPITSDGYYMDLPEGWAGVYTVKQLNLLGSVADLEGYAEVVDWIHKNIKNVDRNVWSKGFGSAQFAFRKKSDYTWFILRYS